MSKQKKSANSSSNSKRDREFFSNQNLKTDLKGRSVRGGAVTILAQGSKFIIQLGSTALLARLLTPNDYGLIGMATPMIGFVQLFKDLGLSTATIQRDEINHRQVSTLFWINLGVSAIISLVFAALAPVAAQFYREPRMLQIVLALSSIFLIGGLSVQHRALIKRQMRFGKIAKIEIISVLVGIVAAIVAAYAGWGYWALVLMQIVTAVVNTLVTWSVCPWRPSLPSRQAGVKSMLAFGGNLTGFNCINYFSRNLDNILIGQYWGEGQLGLYSKAYQLVLLPIQQINSPVNSVALPLLSRVQSDRDKYTNYYYKFVLAIVFLGMPIVAFSFAVTDKLILLVLGEQWLDAIPIFQFLVPAAFMGTFNLASAWVYQSLGRTDRQLRIGIVMSSLDIIIFLISIRWGAIGVAAAYGLSRPFIWFPRFIYCYQDTPLKLRRLATTLARPSFASIAAALLVMLLDHMFLSDIPMVLALVIDGLAYGVLYLGLWAILPQGKQTLIELFRLVNEVKPRKGKKES
ncbi:MAG: lipopolysaccharide biosynthesis protein [Cyanobacteria bacterium J06623_7]